MFVTRTPVLSIRSPQSPGRFALVNRSAPAPLQQLATVELVVDEVLVVELEVVGMGAVLLVEDISDIIVPMTDEEIDLARLRITPGGVESVEEPERSAIRNARDPQLERALDVLKGIMVFTERSPVPASKAKSGKIASRVERN